MCNRALCCRSLIPQNKQSIFFPLKWIYYNSAFPSLFVSAKKIKVIMTSHNSIFHNSVFISQLSLYVAIKFIYIYTVHHNYVYILRCSLYVYVAVLFIHHNFIYSFFCNCVYTYIFNCAYTSQFYSVYTLQIVFIGQFCLCHNSIYFCCNCVYTS